MNSVNIESKPAKIAPAIFGFALAIFLSCADNPSLEFPSEKEAHQRYSSSEMVVYSSSANSSSSAVLSSSSTPSSSSLVPSSSSSLPPSSSSSVCANNNTETHYCSNGVMKQYGSMTDDAGRTYKTVEIGSQVWMAENLSYNASGSKCGNGSNLVEVDNTTCALYGRLYDWETAMLVCPYGWHLPRNDEWVTLTSFIGTGAGTKLKFISGWKNNSNGTDDYGFSALTGGYGNPYSFLGDGTGGYWWSASVPESTADNAHFRSISDYSSGVTSNNISKLRLYSVRCVQN
jgi:uncharacterized protein (TIGR02145 family)